MKRICYYDTQVFSYFIYAPESRTDAHQYTYKNGDIEKHVSILVLEEFISNLQKDEPVGKYNKKMTFMEVWDIFNTKIGFFKKERVELDKLWVDFYNLLSLIRILDIDLVDKDHSEKHIDSMDMLHLVIADRLGCQEFLTTDEKFGFLTKLYVSDFKFKSLQNIIVFKLDKQTLDLNQIGEPIYLPHEQ